MIFLAKYGNSKKHLVSAKDTRYKNTWVATNKLQIVEVKTAIRRAWNFRRAKYITQHIPSTVDPKGARNLFIVSRLHCIQEKPEMSQFYVDVIRTN